MDEITEADYARAANEAIETFRRLTSGRKRFASALLLTAAIGEAASQGLTETVMTERVFQEFRDRERVELGD